MTLKEDIEGKINIKIELLDDDQSLIQLGMDSIKLVELAGLIEEKTDLVIHEDDIYKINGKWLKDLIKKYNNN